MIVAVPSPSRSLAAAKMVATEMRIRTRALILVHGLRKL